MESADEYEIRQQRELWREAVEARDIDRIMSFYVSGPEFLGFDVMPPFRSNGSGALRDSWQHFFEQIDGSPEFQFKETTVYVSGQIAFVHGFTRFRVAMGGNEINLWTRQTSGLRKIDGKWLLVHDHLSIPVD